MDRRHVHNRKGPHNKCCLQRMLRLTFASPPLVAPYCAIPRDYLSDPPLLRAMGFLVSQHGQLGAIPPPHFLSVSPLGGHAKWRCDTPPPLKRGISAILARYPVKTRQMGAIPPSAILSQKGIARYMGVSRTGPLSPHLRLSRVVKGCFLPKGWGGTPAERSWHETLFLSFNFSYEKCSETKTQQCKNLMYSKKGLDYKLGAGWFINHPPVEFISRGLFIKFKGLLCGNPTERGESEILVSGCQAVYKSNPGTAIVCHKRRASGQEKYNTSNIYTVTRRPNWGVTGGG